jgi:HEAT repeat protein
MDVVRVLQAGSLAALALWALLGVAAVIERLRYEQLQRSGRDELDLVDREVLVELASGRAGRDGEWDRGRALVRLADRGDPAIEELARAAIRSDDPELRYAAVTALGLLAPREDWALDLLIEALAEGHERAGRISAALDLAAPHAGPRLVPLLGHPSAVVRFWTVRLLGRYPALRRRVDALHDDPSPQVRAAVLETLRRTAGGPGDLVALRRALAHFDDGPTVRLRAVEATAALGSGAIAPVLLPRLGDRSWHVRAAAEAGLVGLGSPGVVAAADALGAAEPEVRRNAARVLQDTGVVDGLLAEGETALAERVFAAADPRMRETAMSRQKGAAAP